MSNYPPGVTDDHDHFNSDPEGRKAPIRQVELKPINHEPEHEHDCDCEECECPF
jgi:hypothetical protein